MKRHVLLVTLLAAAGTWAATRQGSEVTLAKGETLHEDLYATGATVVVDGVVEGDLIVAAGELRLTGEVRGDLLFLGGRATLAGPVGGSVRGVAGQVALESLVEDDVALAAGDVTVGRFASVGRDLLLAAGTATMNGEVWRKLLAGAGRLTVDGFVGDGVEGQLGQLSLGDAARIFGAVKIATDQEVTLAPGAQLARPIDAAPLPAAARPNAGLGFIGWLRSLVGLLALAAVWIALFPGFSRRAMATLRARPAESFGFGVLALFATPLLAGVVFATGVLVGGWWLSAVVLGVLLVAAAIAAPLVGHFVGQWVMRLFKREGTETARQIVGLVVLTLLAALPVLGFFVIFATASAGVGAQLLALRGRLPVQTSEPLDRLRDPEPEGPVEVGSPS